MHYSPRLRFPSRKTSQVLTLKTSKSYSFSTPPPMRRRATPTPRTPSQRLEMPTPPSSLSRWLETTMPSSSSQVPTSASKFGASKACRCGCKVPGGFNAVFRRMEAPMPMPSRVTDWCSESRDIGKSALCGVLYMSNLRGIHADAKEAPWKDFCINYVRSCSLSAVNGV